MKRSFWLQPSPPHLWHALRLTWLPKSLPSWTRHCNGIAETDIPMQEQCATPAMPCLESMQAKAPPLLARVPAARQATTRKLLPVSRQQPHKARYLPNQPSHLRGERPTQLDVLRHAEAVAPADGLRATQGGDRKISRLVL